MIAPIDAGDLAWWRGDRAAAVSAYREALAGADATPVGRAVEAMARVRLLQFSGSVGPFIHEAALDRALADCPAAEPLCAVALADYQLWMPRFTGADPARVEGILADNPLGGSRRVAAGADPALVADDGMGRGITETGRRMPESPGTWRVAVGVGGAPGLGVAGVVRFEHPDLGYRGHALGAAASVDSRGGGLLSGVLTTASRWQVAALGARQIGEFGDGTYTLATVRGSGAWVPRGPDVGLQLGLGARTDTLGAGWLPVAGPFGAVTLGSGAVWTRVGVDTGFGAYRHAALSWDTRAYPAVLGGTLALRAAFTHVPTVESPFFRLPSAGGSELLRGEPAGRYRDASLFAGQVELRRTVRDPVGISLFADTAWLGEWHATVGGGLRLTLPPGDDNVTRLEVGWCPGSWGVVAGWGNAF